MADITRSVRNRIRPRNPGAVDIVEMYPLPPLDPNLILLCHFNDVDGSTNFVDEKENVWTGFGNAQIDTSQFKFGGSSLHLPGSGDYLTTPDNINWRLDGGSNANLWSIDFWVQFDSDPTGVGAGFFQQFVDTGNYWGLTLSSANLLQFVVRDTGATTVNINRSWTPSINQWYHIAVVKEGTTGYKMFIDGVQQGSTETDTSTILNYGAVLRMGRYTTTTGTNLYLNGWIDEPRILKGSVGWPANFTPPTTEYTIYS